MPIYEYRCAKCGQFEIMQRITEPALKRCPTCQTKVTKLISNTSFQLKGSGWYITDYGRGNGSSAKSTSNKETTETKTESSAATTTTSTEKPGGKSTESAAA